MPILYKMNVVRGEKGKTRGRWQSHPCRASGAKLPAGRARTKRQKY